MQSQRFDATDGDEGQSSDDAALERLLAAARDLGDGNFRRRVVVGGDGIQAQLAAAFNDIAERNQRLVGELAESLRLQIPDDEIRLAPLLIDPDLLHRLDELVLVVPQLDRRAVGAGLLARLA